MKQRKDGRKVQNWHRPLGRRQLGRWYLQHRYDALPYDEDWEWADEQPFYYNDEHDDWDGGIDGERAEYFDQRCVELRQLVRAVVREQPPPLFRREWAFDSAMAQVEEPAVPRAQLEQRLTEFVRSITHFPNNPATRRQISDAIGEDAYADLMRSAENCHDGPNLVRNVSLFAPFWIRSPRTWPGGRTSLVDHLFTRYDVPRFLYPKWTDLLCVGQLKWLCWFILFAQGGSLRRAAELFGWNTQGRFEHHLRQAPAGATSDEACTHAQVMRLGGSPVDCRRILNNPALLIDLTDKPETDPQARFWNATVRWVIGHSADITDEQCEQILNWAVHEQTEARRRQSPPFSLKGRGLRAVLERSAAYRQHINRGWSNYTWNRHGWDWTPINPELEGWRFVELTSGLELQREGQAMHHCVAGYAWRCAEGTSAIVSLLYNGGRRVTVEIHPPTGQLAQAHGTCNRAATPEEHSVIRRWLREVVQRRPEK